MNELSSSLRRSLRARAHALNAVASISQKGLSAAVLAEVDRCLKAHELIKVRAYGTERAARAAMLAEICSRLEAAPVQHIGNILVIYRANPEPPTAPSQPRGTVPPRARPKPPARMASPRRRLLK